VPEKFDDYREPEQLLVGSDRPRPLSPALRARLERSLLALSGTAEGSVAGPAAALPPGPSGGLVPSEGPPPRPLSPEVRERLESTLRRRRPAGPAGPWERYLPVAGVAAAIVVLAAIVVPQLVGRPSRPSGTVAARAPRPPAALFGLSPVSTGAGNGRPGGKGRGLPGGVPGHAGPARLAPSRRAAAPSVPGTASPGTASAAPTTVLSPAVPPTGVPAPTVTGGPATAPVPGPAAAVMEAPAVSGVSPRQGPVGGRNWVLIAGQGFVGVYAVDFGASRALRVTVESPVLLKALAPAHAAGTVDVVIAGAAGRSATSARDRYSFGP
jgi:hypothetical protein